MVRSTKWKTAFVVVAIFTITTAAIVIARSSRRNIPSSNAEPLKHDTSISGPTSSQSRQNEAEIVTLHPWGFEPKEINRPTGPFFLALDDRSGLSAVEVTLDSESGHRLHAPGLSKNKAKWRQRLTLPPGTYVLREANNPEWTCRITIE
jgi:hypothetical protein